MYPKELTGSKTLVEIINRAIMTVDKCELHKTYVINFIKTNSEVRQKLMNMGLTPGVKLIVVGKALFGDPIRIKVRNYIIAIRKSEAKNIVVE